MKIINLILIILPIPLLLTAYPLLCWLAVLNAVSYLVIALMIPHLIAKSAMDKFKLTIEMLEQQGATPEELERAFQTEIVITEQDRKAVPSWIYYLSLCHVFIGAILFIAGIVFLFR